MAEHSDGRAHSVALAPDRPVGAVTRELLEAVSDLGGRVAIDPAPQEVSWSVALDEDEEHRSYETAQVTEYFAAATRAALVLAAFRAPYRGRSTPVNALDDEDAAAAPDPRAPALAFARSAFQHSCEVCGWDPALTASADGAPPPVR